MKKYLLLFLMVLLSSAMFMPANGLKVRSGKVKYLDSYIYDRVEVEPNGNLIVESGGNAPYVTSSGIVKIEGGKVRTLINEDSGIVDVISGTVETLKSMSSGKIVIKELGEVQLLNNQGTGKISIEKRGIVNQLNNYASGETTVSGGTIDLLYNQGTGEINITQYGMVDILKNYNNGKVTVEGTKGATSITELTNEGDATITVSQGTIQLLNNLGKGEVNVTQSGVVNELNNYNNGKVTVEGTRGTIKLLNNSGIGGVNVTRSGVVNELNNRGIGEINVTQNGIVQRLYNGNNGKVTVVNGMNVMSVIELHNIRDGAIILSGGTVESLNNAGRGEINVEQSGVVNRLDNYADGKVIVNSETDAVAVTTLNNTGNGAITVSKGIVGTITGKGTININGGTVGTEGNKVSGINNFNGNININGGTVRKIEGGGGTTTITNGTIEDLNFGGTIDIKGGEIKKLSKNANISGGSIDCLNIFNPARVTIKKNSIIELYNIKVNDKELSNSNISCIDIESAATRENTTIFFREESLYRCFESKRFSGSADMSLIKENEETIKDSMTTGAETVTIPDGFKINNLNIMDRSSRGNITILNYGRVGSLTINKKNDVTIRNLLKADGFTKNNLANKNRISKISILCGYSGNNSSATLYCSADSGYNLVGDINSNSGAGTFKFCDNTLVKGEISGWSSSTVFEDNSSFEGKASVGSINFNSTGTFNIIGNRLGSLVNNGEGKVIVSDAGAISNLSNVKGIVEIKGGTVGTLNNSSIENKDSGATVKVEGGVVTTLNNNTIGTIKTTGGNVTNLNNNASGVIIVNGGDIDNLKSNNQGVDAHAGTVHNLIAKVVNVKGSGTSPTIGGNIDKIKFTKGSKMVIAAGSEIILNSLKYIDGSEKDIPDYGIRTYVTINNPGSGENRAMICCKDSKIYELFRKYNKKSASESVSTSNIVKFSLLKPCTKSDEIEDSTDKNQDILMGVYVPSGIIIAINEKTLPGAVVEKGAVLQIVDDLTNIDKLISYGNSIMSSGVVKELEVKNGGNVKISGGKVTNVKVEQGGNLNIKSRNSYIVGNMNVEGNVDFNGGRVKLDEEYQSCTCTSSTCKCCTADVSSASCECSDKGECRYNKIAISNGGTMSINSGNIEVPIKVSGGKLTINGGKIGNHMLIDTGSTLVISNSQLGMSTSSLDIRGGDVIIENSTLDFKNSRDADGNVKENILTLKNKDSSLKLSNVNINSEATAVEVINGKLVVDGSTNEIKARNIGICVKGGTVEINGGTINGAKTGIECSAGNLMVRGGTIRNCTTGIYQPKGTGVTVNNVEITDCGAAIDVYDGTCNIYRGTIKRCSVAVVSRKKSKINFCNVNNSNNSNDKDEKNTKPTFNINSCYVCMIIEEDGEISTPDLSGSDTDIKVEENANISMKNYMSGIEVYYRNGKKFNPGTIGGKVTFNKYIDIYGQQKGYDYVIILDDNQFDSEIETYYKAKEANVYLKHKTA